MDGHRKPAIPRFMKIVDKFRTMGCAPTPDTPQDAKVARDFGDRRTSGCSAPNTMFNWRRLRPPLFILRKMILSKTVDEREAGGGRIVSLREASRPRVRSKPWTLLPSTDPAIGTQPLHEFVPRQGKQKKLAASLGIKPSDIKETRRGPAQNRIPMMGHRGVRLGHHLSRVTEMQVRAIFESGPPS